MPQIVYSLNDVKSLVAAKHGIKIEGVRVYDDSEVCLSDGFRDKSLGDTDPFIVMDWDDQ